MQGVTGSAATNSVNQDVACEFNVIQRPGSLGLFAPEVGRYDLARMLDAYIQEACPGENRVEAARRMAQWRQGCSLDLEHLGLNELPSNLSFLSGIDRLFLAGNRLKSLPDSLCLLTTLEILKCNDNVLRRIPEALGELSSLREVWLNENELTELPSSLVNLSSRCYLNLNVNLLSQAVRLQLHQAIVARHLHFPHQGPQIYYDMALTCAPLAVVPLSDEIASWRDEAQRPVDNHDKKAWLDAIAHLSPAECGAFSQQLARMRLTAHYSNAPQDLVNRVNKVLDYIQINTDVLNTCVAIAIEGTETCDDRIALAFIELEEAIIHHQSLKTSTAQTDTSIGNTLRSLIDTGQALHKSKLLKDIAQKKLSSLVGFVDPTEVILKYVVKLSAELNLPCQLNNMIFENCALQVGDADIEQARNTIHEKINGSEFDEYLAEWQPWRNILERHFPKEYREAKSEIAEKQASLYEQLDNLNDELQKAEDANGRFSERYLQALEQCNLVHATYRSVEAKVLAELTRHVRQQFT